MFSFFLRFNIYSFFLVTEKPSVYINSIFSRFPGNDQRYWPPLYSALSWLKFEDFVTNITVTVRSDENRLQEFHYEDKPPKLYLLEECKLKCAEYDGLPSAFHKYEQVISKRDRKNFKRDDDRSSNANLFFVDSHYDFSRAEWYSGGSIFIISWYKTRIQASKEFLIGFGIKTIHTQNTIFQFWTID